MFSGLRQIPVLRNGRIVSAYPKPPLISSDELWPASLKVELYRLPPTTTEASTGCAHGLIVNLGAPVGVRWGHNKPDRLITFPTGGMCLGSRGEPIPAFGWSDSITNAVLHLSLDLFPVERASFRLHAEMGCTDPRILALVRLMVAELHAGAPHGALYGESLGHDLAVHLHRHYAIPARERAKGGLGPQRRRLICEFLHDRCASPLTLSDLAGQAGLSVFHFSRAFKEEFGVTPYQFVLKLRIERAKHLLGHSSCDIAELSRRLGFSSASHFGRIFRRSTGLTPASFRSQHRSISRPTR
jgi:AraC-like DNA-binding protein